MAKAINALSIETFFDAVDIESGDPFEEKIRENLDNSDELLVLLTPDALDRPYVWIEVGAAWMQRKRIVGILYRLTSSDIATGRRTPALLKSIHLRDLNDFDRYLDELRRRAGT